MDNIEALKYSIVKALKEVDIEVDPSLVVIEKSKDPTHGDYATNTALKFSKQAGKNPVAFANELVKHLDCSFVSKIEIAGPGFINFYVSDDSLQNIIGEVINKGDNFGRTERLSKRVNVEFVSANPTGDLHVGTARGAAIGDCLSRILDFAGYDVTKEYYINDAGSQITNLALSIQARYKELFGQKQEIPEDGYMGQDIIDIAKEIKDEIGDKGLSMEDPISYFKETGIKKEMDKIVRDLSLFSVQFDVYSSEKTIRSNNSVEKEIEFLKPHSYVEDGAVILKTTDYVDDKDRVIVKSNGEYTYFLPDVVYHCNKLSRNYDKLIDVLGSDHHGYINRMKSALMMHGYDKDILDVTLIQMVRFIKDGVEKKASKRSGDAYKLRELVEDVGVDAARYFFAMRAPSTHLDFDLGLAVEQSSNNPVYYSQYAHARMCSVIANGKDLGIDVTGNGLNNEKEKNIMKLLANFPKIVDSASTELAPYKITNYVHELAESVHSWYNDTKIVDKDNIDVSRSRLALATAIKQVIKNALYLVGVSAPEHM